ncbi:MAG: ERF family protein [Bacteroidetes bacterium]|nr:ERF family protein [Bacteroidota bacterium]
MANESKKLNLYEKIQAVSSEVMNVEKDMTVEAGRYSYKAVSDNAVTMRVKAAEIQFRLISIPIKQELIDSQILKKVKDGYETNTFIDNIKMTVRIIDLDDTKQFLDIESFGKGVDTSDKGFGKASTYARKYALLNAYKIATGEDPDKDKSPELITLKTDEKKNEIKAVCEKNEAVKTNVLSHFAVSSIDDLLDADVKTVYTQFKVKNLVK